MTHPHNRLLIIDSHIGTKTHYLPLLTAHPQVKYFLAKESESALTALKIYNYDKDSVSPITHIILDKDTLGANNIILAKRIIFYNGMRELECPIYLISRDELSIDEKNSYSNLIKDFYRHPLKAHQLNEILNN